MNVMVWCFTATPQTFPVSLFEAAWDIQRQYDVAGVVNRLIVLAKCPPRIGLTMPNKPSNEIHFYFRNLG